MKMLRLTLTICMMSFAIAISMYFHGVAEHAEATRKNAEAINARLQARVKAIESDPLMDGGVQAPPRDDNGGDNDPGGRKGGTADAAGDDTPLPASVLSPFTTFTTSTVARELAPGGLPMISLGSVSVAEREKEHLDTICMVMRCRRLTLVERYGDYVHVLYQAVTPRETSECPTGTAFMIATSVYAAAAGTCKEEAKDQLPDHPAETRR